MNEKKKLRRLPKRILSFVLTLVMVFTLMPTMSVEVKAADYDDAEMGDYGAYFMYDEENCNLIIISEEYFGDDLGSLSSDVIREAKEKFVDSNNGISHIELVGYNAIGENAFLSLTGNYAWFDSRDYSITICEEVESIGSSAFDSCSHLTGVIFKSENNLKSIGNAAFKDCTGLESIEIPESVESIGESAFRSCREITSLNLGNVTSIGNGAFVECGNLATVVLSDNLEVINSKVFEYCCCAPLSLTYN